MTISIDSFESWLRNKNLKERTIEEYLYYFNKFQDNVFNQETVSRFLANKSHRNIVARSFLINLRKFILVNYKELGFSIDQRLEVSEVELPKITGRAKVREIIPLKLEEIQLLEKCLETEKLKLMLLCSYYGALRVGEMLKIKVISFNWEDWKKDMSKMGECKVLGKGDKEGVAFFPSKLMIRLTKYIKSQKKLDLNSTIFIKNYVNHRSIKSGATTWQKKLREAGIKARLIKFDGKGIIIQETSVHPHRLRHSYASYLANEKGMDIRKVQILLRHSSLTSTQRYVHIDREKLKEELAS